MSPEERQRRADTLDVGDWALLAKLDVDGNLALKPGGQLIKRAVRLHQLAFVWPGRAPWWKITRHGRAALEDRAERMRIVKACS